jgi:hypothetical protein
VDVNTLYEHAATVMPVVCIAWTLMAALFELGLRREVPLAAQLWAYGFAVAQGLASAWALAPRGVDTVVLAVFISAVATYAALYLRLGAVRMHRAVVRR